MTTILFYIYRACFFYDKYQHPDFLPLPLIFIKQEQNKTKQLNKCTTCCTEGGNAAETGHCQGWPGNIAHKAKTVENTEAQIQSG